MTTINSDILTFEVRKLVATIDDEVLNTATQVYKDEALRKGLLPLKEEFVKRKSTFQTHYTLFYVDVGRDVLEARKCCDEIAALFQTQPYLKEIRYPLYRLLEEKNQLRIREVNDG